MIILNAALFWNITDWTAFAVTLLGVYLLSEYKRSGFIINGAGSVLWVIIGLHSGLEGLLVLNIVLFILYIKGYLKWKTNKVDNIKMENIN